MPEIGAMYTHGPNPIPGQIAVYTGPSGSEYMRRMNFGHVLSFYHSDYTNQTVADERDWIDHQFVPIVDTEVPHA